MSSRPALTLVVNNHPTNIQPTQTDRLESFDLDEQMDKFAQWLLVHRGLAKTTIENYRKVVRKVLRDNDLFFPSKKDVENAVVSLHASGKSYNHIVNTSIAVERYMEFIGRPMNFGRPRKPKKVVKHTLSEAEVAVLMAACRTTRERAMLGILAYTGIRNNELCRLMKKDVDVANSLITVREGKGSKDRIIPISGDGIQLILEYLAEWPRDDDDWLFTTLRTNRQYTGWALRQFIRTVTGRTNIKKRVHPHIFRHSLATNMLARGAGIITIQMQLGHNQIETTRMYLNPKTTHLRAEYQAYAPSYV